MNDDNKDESDNFEKLNDISRQNSDLKRENSTVNYYCDPILPEGNSYSSNNNLCFDNFVYKNFNSLDDTNRSIAYSPKIN